MLDYFISFLFILVFVAVFLGVAVILGGKNPEIRDYFRFFYEEDSERRFRPDPKTKSGKKARENARKQRIRSVVRFQSDKPVTQTVVLVQKVDERRRVVNSAGRTFIYDPYFELVFETEEGEPIRLVTSRAVFKEIPFKQRGALTYKGTDFLRFRFGDVDITE
jgi:hypothetical protein